MSRAHEEPDVVTHIEFQSGIFLNLWAIYSAGPSLNIKSVIVLQSSGNFLQIYHLFAFLELKDKSFNLFQNSSFLIG